MDEPRDDIDTWLEERVTPLLPHPGAFEQVRKRARRRKLTQATLAAAGAAIVVAGVITVPRLVLSGGTGGAPAVANGATTPANQPTPSAGGPSVNGRSTRDTASPTPTAPPLVPANFAASSVTFVSTTTGWVIGQAGTPGHCGPPKAYVCTSVAATSDGGSTWHGVPAPVVGAPNGGSGVSQIRSLDGRSAWAFGPQLYATHDGGQHWTRIPTHGMRVTDLETVNGIVYAMWARCSGTGVDFAAGCTSFSLYSSPAGTDDWSPVPGVTGLQASGGAPASAQLVLTGTQGYLLTPGGQLFSGPVTSPAHWRMVAPLVCAPGGAGLSGHPLGGMLASTGLGLVLMCNSQAHGNRQAKALYYSSNGGVSWNASGQAPARGIAMSLSGTPTGPVLVATTSGIDISTDAPSATYGALTWRTARGATAPGGYSYVGMTTSEQGVAVPVDESQDAVWFTYDGGTHWQESLVR